MVSFLVSKYLTTEFLLGKDIDYNQFIKNWDPSFIEQVPSELVENLGRIKSSGFLVWVFERYLSLISFDVACSLNCNSKLSSSHILSGNNG